METPKPLRVTLRDWAREWLPSCRDVTQLQSRALDESLPWRVRAGVKGHLLYCVWCRRYGRQLRFLHDALRHNGDRLAGDCFRPLPAEARRQIKDFLRQERRRSEQ